MNPQQVPESSGAAALRGFLYQSWIAVRRWLELRDGESLLCEGQQDLDRLADGGSVFEQIKNVARNLSSRSTPVRETLASFLRAFVDMHGTGQPARFVFTTTAALAKQRTRGSELDLLRLWHAHSPPSPGLFSQLEAYFRDIGCEAEADYLAERRLWPAFFEAVEWRFDEPELDPLVASIHDLIGERFPDLPARVLGERLLSVVLFHSARTESGLRVLSRSELTELSRSTKRGLQEWSSGPDADMVRSWIQQELKIRALQRQNARARGLVASGRLPMSDKPATAPPSRLLIAGYEALAFRERDELRVLSEWCQSDANARLITVTGGAGVGKTRLLIELAKRLRDAGWIAGFVRDSVEPHAVDELLGGDVPRLLAIDYVEGREELVAAIADRLVDPGNDPPPTRIVLVGRARGEWWRRVLAKGPRIEHVLGDVQNVHLDRVPGSGEERVQIYRDALATYREALNVEGTVDDYEATPDLTGMQCGHMLHLQIAAVNTLLGSASSGVEEDALDQLIQHERRSWRRIVAQHAERPLAADVEELLPRFMAMLTLVGGAGDRESARRWAGVGLDPGEFGQLIAAAERVLHHAYFEEAGTDAPWVPPMRPDLLGEYLVASEVREHPEILRVVAHSGTLAAIEAATSVLCRVESHVWAAQDRLVSQFLELDLVKLAPVAVRLAPSLPPTLGHALAETLARGGGPELACRLADLIPRESIVLRRVRTWVAATVLEDLGSTASSRESAAALAAAAVSLAELGDRRAAAQLAREAVSRWRAMAEKSPGNGADLAMALSDLSVIQCELRETDEAVQSGEEAASILTELSQTHAGVDVGLGFTLHNLGLSYREIGRFDDAVKALERAVAIRDRIHDGSLHAAIDSAASRVALSCVRTLAGDLRPAAKDAARAVRELQSHVRSSRDAVLPDLAAAYLNHGTVLGEMGHGKFALRATQQARSMLAELVAGERVPFLVDLARCEHNLSLHHADTGDAAAAESHGRRAVNLHEEAVSVFGASHGPVLAHSLHNHAACLGALDRREAAASCVVRAVRLVVELGDRRVREHREFVGQLLATYDDLTGGGAAEAVMASARRILGSKRDG